jgi:serine/threonine protein kinase
MSENGSENPQPPASTDQRFASRPPAPQLSAEPLSFVHAVDWGQPFAGYRAIRLLGSGGMGEVYLAQHPRLPRRDASKLLPHDWSADAEFWARFMREADLASTLWHCRSMRATGICGDKDSIKEGRFDVLKTLAQVVGGLAAFRLSSSKGMRDGTHWRESASG